MSEVAHITQPGCLEGRYVRIGKLDMDGAKLKVVMTDELIPLGNGVEISDEIPTNGNMVGLAVMAEAAARLGWPHPANARKYQISDLPRLRVLAKRTDYGEEEIKELKAWIELLEKEELSAAVAARTSELVAAMPRPKRKYTRRQPQQISPTIAMPANDSPITIWPNGFKVVGA